MASPNKAAVEVCDFSKLSVRELRNYLRERGAHVSGNRPELIKRAKGIEGLGTRTLKEIKLDDERNRIVREGELFVTPFGEKLPKPCELKGCWDDDLTRVPMFRQEDLYNYLVLSQSRTFDKENMNARKQLKAKVFYEDRHVHTVRYHQISKDCTHCYIRANVIPSLPTDNKKKDYQAWACLSKLTGMVHAAGCDCPAGEGESCNHVAALLYAIVDISEKKKDGTDVSTSKKCKWNQPRKRKLSPKLSQCMAFKKVKIHVNESDVKKKLFTEKAPKLHSVKPIDLPDFCKKLKKCSPYSALLLSTTQLECHSKKTEKLPDLHKIEFMYCDTTSLDSDTCKQHFVEYFDTLKCTEEDCLKIEKLTKGQAKNEMWMDARSGRLTSSVFGYICKQKAETKPDNIVKKIMNYDTFETPAVKWGKGHEVAARRIYQKQSQKMHPGLKVFNCGLIVNTDFPHLGASPDGVVRCCEKCVDRNGLLEIKCPFKYRYISVEDACRDKGFYCELINGRVRLKTTHIYYYQVQGQLALSRRKWCDFFVWTLKGYTVERISLDESFWNAALKKLNSFYLKGVIPELFSERVKRGKSLYADDKCTM